MKSGVNESNYKASCYWFVAGHAKQVVVCILEACRSNRLALLVKLKFQFCFLWKHNSAICIFLKETKVDASIALSRC